MVAASSGLARGDVCDYTLGSRRIRVLVVSATAYSRAYPVVVLVHSRADGDVPGILLPLPADPSLLAKVDRGLRRLLGL